MPPVNLSRRHLLGASLAGAGALGVGGLSRVARASVARSDLKFVFVRIFGGWDTTRVFADALDNPNLDFERDAQSGTVGDLRFIDHPDRPRVRTFFEDHGDRTLILNGLVVPSINHRICERLAMTGGNRETAADWPTVIAHAQADRFNLPHVVASGRSIPGKLGGSVVRIGDSGQVGRLLDGGILDESDVPAAAPDPSIGALIDQFTLDRATQATGAASSPRRRELAQAWCNSLTRAETMKGLVDQVHWDTNGTFASQVVVASDLLRLGLSRCVTLSFDRLTWDSHQDNDDKQHANFVDLFDGLTDLMDTLSTTPGPMGGMLSDETVVVVMSEMGRTPQLNSSKGKDHWGFTSSMLIGPGVAGGRTAGGFGELFYGEKMDLESGELDSGGRELTPGIFGATLLELADVGPVASLPEYSPIRGVLG
jgi:hypothetical protein